MKRIFAVVVLMMTLLTAAGCMPHTTGETEVGVRTRKMGIFRS